MDIQNSEYLLLLLACWIIPFVFTIIHHRMLEKEGMAVFPITIFIAAAPFVIWDIVALERDHWSFNKRFLTGIKIAKLPIEEYLFFLLIPYACLLLWVMIRKYHSVQDLLQDLRYHFENKDHA